MTSSNEELSVDALLPPVAVLTALWCHTHRGLLLEDEIELDRTVGRTEEAWERTRAAALEGRVDDIPVACETLAAWKCEDVLGDGPLDDCADLLPSALVAVETVWGECRHDEVPKVALRAAFDFAAARRERILAEYRPPASDVPSLWHEVHQGCALPDALMRKRVLHLVDRAISRSPDRWITARVELALAAEYDAKGNYKRARESLDAAVRASWPLKRIDRREPAGVALAEHLWRCGEVDLRETASLPAEGRLLPASSHADSRTRCRSARCSWAPSRYIGNGTGSSPGARSRTRTSQLATGIAAERIARELCTEHPDDARSWETKARVLHANARYRSTLDAAERWTELAPDSGPARSLLARAFARVGYVGRAPAASIAAAAIELCEAGQVLPLDELEELAEICYRAQIMDWARRADDLVWACRAEREPGVEWLVAATLRRCHGPWADDAPAWIARLADRGPHVLAGWGADRADSVQHWCELIDRQMRAPAVWRRLKTELTPASRAIAREENDLAIRARARNVALGAAADLGCSEECATNAIGAPTVDSNPEVTELAEAPSGSTEQWSRHRAAIEAVAGPRIVIALRASEVAQQAWTAVRNDRPNGASLIVREIFQEEKLAWIRWAENQPSLDDKAPRGPARGRLGLLRELARFTDDELRRTEWATKWDDLDRW